MMDYAVASRRRQSLHRYLIAAVTTLARPEAICEKVSWVLKSLM